MCTCTGRTGRAGRPGKAITFYTEDDIMNLRRYVGVKVVGNPLTSSLELPY